MKVGAQFLIAVRLLSTVKNLSAHLTLTGRGAQLNLYCLEKKVIYLDTSSQFPQSWFQGRGETAIAGELAPTASFEQKIQTIRKIEAKPDLLTAFREASRGILTTFFQGPVLECRLKQITPVASFALLTLPDIFFDYAHPFVKNISPEELLPTKEIPFKQSANFLEHSASIKMGAQEGYLVSRLEQLLTVREIVSSVPGDEADTKRNLLMFWAFGVLDSPVLNQLLPKVDAAKEIPKETPASAASDHGTAAQGESIEELVAGVNLAYQNLSKKDFYSLLGVTARGDLDEVKAAYYKLARKFHPDRFYGLHDPVLKEKVDVIFSAINVAYETLKNNKRRLEYDNAPKETKVIGKTTLNSENTSTVLTKETKNRIAEEHFKKLRKATKKATTTRPCSSSDLRHKLNPALQSSGGS